MQNAIIESFDLGDGRNVSIESGKLAKQADGSVLVRMGNTVLLAAVVSDKEAGDEVDFLPLSVEYKEKFYAAGKYPGGFLKREGRPNDHEILICRLIDRALRPLFPSDYHSNTIVTVHLVSSDNDINPDALACLAASAAITASDIPFNGPVSEVRVARIDGKFIVNPAKSLMENADMDLMVAASAKDVVMVEGEMLEVSEEEMVEAIKVAHEAIKVQCAAQLSLAEKMGRTEKREYCHEDSDEDLLNRINEFAFEKFKAIAREGNADKHLRGKKFKEVKTAFIESIGDEAAEKRYLIGQYLNKTQKKAVRRVMLEESIRLDGRKLDEVRSIWSEVDYLPSVHGSAVFTRGETQSLTTVTLGSSADEQKIDGVTREGSDRFILHYNFPSYSTGEARMSRGTSRREVGHGNLAMRALKPMVPADCPYTVRVVSEILESNGSSSMATVCAGSMAMMDAGVKLPNAVSGIAMGLITDDEGNYAILSDILGDEDHLGDMDFKVAGTPNGITATQMDIKVDGLSYEVLTKALIQAKAGRMTIMNEMNKTISSANTDYKEHAPRIEMLIIEKEFIGAVIGPGGKVIQEIQATSGATIHIEEVEDKGHVQILAENGESLRMAKERIQMITAIPEVNEVYEAKVVSIMPYGAFVEFMPGKQGLLHISEISWERIEQMEGVFKEGEMIKVKLLAIDRDGKFKLSRKVLTPKPERKEA